MNSINTSTKLLTLFEKFRQEGRALFHTTSATQKSQFPMKIIGPGVLEIDTNIENYLLQILPQAKKAATEKVHQEKLALCDYALRQGELSLYFYEVQNRGGALVFRSCKKTDPLYDFADDAFLLIYCPEITTFNQLDRTKGEDRQVLSSIFPLCERQAPQDIHYQNYRIYYEPQVQLGEGPIPSMEYVPVLGNHYGEKSYHHQYRNLPYGPQFGNEGQNRVYAIALLIYYLINGFAPHFDTGVYTFFKGKLDLGKNKSKISRSDEILSELLSKCLNQDHNDRPSYNELTSWFSVYKDTGYWPSDLIKKLGLYRKPSLGLTCSNGRNGSRE